MGMFALTIVVRVGFANGSCISVIKTPGYRSKYEVQFMKLSCNVP